MRNTNCVICSKEFAPRANKLYCSPACKQRGYTEKKQEREEQQAIEAVRRQFQFYYPEYEAYRKKYPNSIVKSFILYCFFRKNLVEISGIKQMYHYISSYSPRWWDDFWDNQTISPARKKYLEFEATFFSDETKIFFSEQISTNE